MFSSEIRKLQEEGSVFVWNLFFREFAAELQRRHIPFAMAMDVYESEDSTERGCMFYRVTK